MTIAKVNKGIEDLMFKIKQTDLDTKSVRYNIDLIKSFEERDFNNFYSNFNFLIEESESKFKKIIKKKEKLEFCKFIEKEIERENFRDSALRET